MIRVRSALFDVPRLFCASVPADLAKDRVIGVPPREDGGETTVLPDERGVPETDGMGDVLMSVLVVIVGVVGRHKHMEATADSCYHS